MSHNSVSRVGPVFKGSVNKFSHTGHTAKFGSDDTQVGPEFNGDVGEYKQDGHIIQESNQSNNYTEEFRLLTQQQDSLKHDIEKIREEAIIGWENTIQTEEWLKEGLERANSVCRIRYKPEIVKQEGIDPKKAGVASGFLIAPNLLLTNCHVLIDMSQQTEHELQSATANALKLQYEFCTPTTKVVRLYNGSGIIMDKTLDYALIPLIETSDDIAPLKAIKKEVQITRANIIHYPGDGSDAKRCFSIYKNSVIQQESDFIRYQTDTLQGSSGTYLHGWQRKTDVVVGAPVFNLEWDVVALHAGSQDSTDPAWNQGFAIWKILEHIEQHAKIVI